MPYQIKQDYQYIGAGGELTAAEELRVQEIQALSDSVTGEALAKTTGSIVNKNIDESGGTWGSITGTLSDQTDLQTALDAKAASLGADDNYVTDTEKIVIGNTSGANTGDQDLSGKADVDQTMYIGTTAVAINRGTATLNLAGIGTLGVGAITSSGYLETTETIAGALKTQVRHINSSNTVGTGARISFRMLDSNSAIQTYGRISTEIDVNTAGSEDGTMRFSVIGGGAFDDLLILDGSSKLASFAGGIKIPNNTWMKGRNNADDADINIFKITTTDDIQTGGTFSVGPIEFAEDSGAVSAMDMPVSATPDAAVEMSYTFRIDGNNILTIFAEADSSGGIQNESVNLHKVLKLATGTTSIAPIKFTSGTNLTTPEAGVIEFDGNDFYMTVA